MGNKQGKVAIVTGAASGIGKSIAEEFCNGGHSVLVADLNESDGEAVAGSLRDQGFEARFQKVDLRVPESIGAMITAAVDAFGRLDVLVNNARPRLEAAQFPESMDSWDLALNVILRAPAQAVAEALEHFESAGGGAVINISSVAAFNVTGQPVAYHAAKAGLVQLTKCLAVELGPRKVRINAICPALVDTGGSLKLDSNPVKKLLTETLVPLGRAGQVRDIARLALWLSGDDAGYITGQSFVIDGGLSAIDQFYIARKTLKVANAGNSD